MKILKIVHGSKSLAVWIGYGLLLGISLQFEAASAVFFLPATLVIFLTFRKSIIWRIFLIFSLFTSFFITLLPQLIFNYRHDNILFSAFTRFLVTEKSFSPTHTDFYLTRLNFYYQSFINLLTLDRLPGIILSCLLVFFTITIIKHIPKKPLTVITLWLLTPLFLLLFYKGNNGYVWGYYFTGVYQIFFLLISAILSYTYSYSFLPFRRGIVGLFIAYLVVWNGFHLYHYLRANPDGDTAIMLGNQLQAVDWIFTDASDRSFNVDVYVPPVITHAYDYLFLWRGSTRFHRQPDIKLHPLLYTLSEVDPPHPERLSAWQLRQAGIGKIEDAVRFGGITVDRRWRL